MRDIITVLLGVICCGFIINNFILQNNIVEEYSCFNHNCSIEQDNDMLNKRWWSFTYSYNYTTGVYDCKNFSHDAVEQLKLMNISAVQITVRQPNQTTYHRVIAILVEPQTGYIISDQEWDFLQLVGGIDKINKKVK